MPRSASRVRWSTGADSLNAQIGLARWMLQTGEIDQALAHAQRAQELDPDSLDARLIAGVVHRRRKDLDAALTLLENAHLKSPLNFDVNNQLALTLLERADESSGRRAVAYAELNQRLYPNNVEVVATLAWVCYHQDRKADAERLFSAIAAALVSGPPPASGDSIYYLANFHADQGRTAEARRLLAMLLKREVPGVYRQDAEALLARLGEQAADDAETPAETGPPAEADDGPTDTDAKEPIKP